MTWPSSRVLSRTSAAIAFIAMCLAPWAASGQPAGCLVRPPQHPVDLRRGSQPGPGRLRRARMPSRPRWISWPARAPGSRTRSRRHRSARRAARPSSRRCIRPPSGPCTCGPRPCRRPASKRSPSTSGPRGTTAPTARRPTTTSRRPRRTARPTRSGTTRASQAHWRNRPDPQQPFFAVFNITTTHESQIRVDDAQFAKVTAALAPGARHDPAQAHLPPYYPDTPLVRKDWAQVLRSHLGHGRPGEGDPPATRRRRAGGPHHRLLLGRSRPRTAARETLRLRFGPQGPAHRAMARRHRPGLVVGDLVSLMDLGPTALALAGVPYRAHAGAAVPRAGQAARPLATCSAIATGWTRRTT